MTKPKIVVLDGRRVAITDDSRFDFTPEEKVEQKKISAKCGHVKRRLVRKEVLTGKVLEFALGVVGDDSDIGIKLKNGEQLTEYESHLMIDVFLLHTRLSRPRLAKPGEG